MLNVLNRIYTDDSGAFQELLRHNLVEGVKTFIVTANPETLMIGCQNAEFYQILAEPHTTIVPDGIGVIKALKSVRNIKCNRITGVETSEYLLSILNDTGKSIYLYGAKKEVLSQLLQVIKEKYPNVKIAGAHNGYDGDSEEIFEDILSKSPDVVLVALGIPRQELLISQYYDRFEKGIFMGVGGTFDVLSGTKKRAPKLFIKLNLEWLYRISKEPSRLKRFYKNNVLFFHEIKKYKKRNRQNEAN